MWIHREEFFLPVWALLHNKFFRVESLNLLGHSTYSFKNVHTQGKSHDLASWKPIHTVYDESAFLQTLPDGHCGWF